MPRLAFPFRRKSFSRGRSHQYDSIDDDAAGSPLAANVHGGTIVNNDSLTKGTKNWSRGRSVDSLRQRSFYNDHLGGSSCQPCSCHCGDANDKRTHGGKRGTAAWKGKRSKGRDHDDDLTDASTLSDSRQNVRIVYKSPCEDVTQIVGDAMLNLVDGFSACAAALFQEGGNDRHRGRSRSRSRARKSKRDEDEHREHSAHKEASPSTKVTAADLRDDISPGRSVPSNPKRGGYYRSLLTRAARPEPSDDMPPSQGSPRTVATVNSSESWEEREDEGALDDFVANRAKSLEFADFEAAPIQNEAEPVVKQELMEKQVAVEIETVVHTLHAEVKPAVTTDNEAEVKPAVTTDNEAEVKPAVKTKNEAEVKLAAETQHTTEIKPTETTKTSPPAIPVTVPEKSKSCECCGVTPSKEVKLKICARCQSVYYCGAACQAKDWYEKHMRSCKPKES